MSRLDRLICAVGCGVLMLLVSACGTVGVEELRAPDRSVPMDQSIVFLIHGDADYLYHDSDGTARQADEDAVAKAVRVAERNPDAEVFIFHQRPKKRRLLLFPRDDGTFYTYRGGELIARETYRRETGTSRLDPEVAYYERYRTEGRAPSTGILVYMGHEIPELDDVRYDASRREGVLNVEQFSGDVSRLTPDAEPFDLMVLSTCNGGTPHTIGALAPFADHIVASPDDLHLSHLDLAALERLDLSLGGGDTGDMPGTSRELARRLAGESYERLANDLQTVVSVAVYDTDRIREYVDQVAPAYDSLLTELQDVRPAELEFVDCADTPQFVREEMSAGVEVYFRPPRFGRRADRSTHSGWQCRKEVKAIGN